MTPHNFDVTGPSACPFSVSILLTYTLCPIIRIFMVLDIKPYISVVTMWRHRPVVTSSNAVSPDVGLLIAVSIHTFNLSLTVTKLLTFSF